MRPYSLILIDKIACIRQSSVGWVRREFNQHEWLFNELSNLTHQQAIDSWLTYKQLLTQSPWSHD